MKRVAINGFGRIGRLTLRNLLKRNEVEVVAINDMTDNLTLAHLLKYDTAQRMMPNNIIGTTDSIIIDGKSIKCYAIKNPLELPWKELEIDVVIECTGRFTDKEAALMHHQAGAKKIVISAPATGGVKTIVLGVNDEEITNEEIVFSNASCTTNCLAPIIKVLDKNFGFNHGLMSTAHAYTADQNLQDGPHKDLRRARAAAENIVPTTTGAAEAVAKVYPAVKDKISGKAIRVPVITGSLVDLTCLLNKTVSESEINASFQKAAENEMKGILEFTEAPLVSSDIIGNTHSTIFDSKLTKIIGPLVSVVAWYDNEAGYSARLSDLVCRIALVK